MLKTQPLPTSYEAILEEEDIDFSLAEQLLWIAEFFKMADLQRALIEVVLRPQLSLPAAFPLITKTHLKLKNSANVEQIWLDLLHLLVDFVASHIKEVAYDFQTEFKNLPNGLLN